MHGGGQGVVVVGGDPICNRRGDVAVNSPADDVAVILGGLSFVLGVFQGNGWQLTWSFHLRWEVGVIGGPFFVPGVAKYRPGKSDQGGGGVLSMNFLEIFLEFATLCLGDDAHPT